MRAAEARSILTESEFELVQNASPRRIGKLSERELKSSLTRAKRMRTKASDESKQELLAKACERYETALARNGNSRNGSSKPAAKRRSAAPARRPVEVPIGSLWTPDDALGVVTVPREPQRGSRRGAGRSA